MPWNECDALHYVSGRDYACQPNDWWEGCGLHCYPCDATEFAPGEFGASIYGRRWLRPSAEFESRTAHGIWKFLRSGNPFETCELLPGATATAHELANCWQQISTGAGFPVTEWFETQERNVHLCDCDGGDNECSEGPCRLYIDHGGWSTTCAAFHGAGWPPDGSGVGIYGNNFQCTGKLAGDKLIPVRPRGGGLYNFYPFSVGASEDRVYRNGCTSNAAVRLWGHHENGGEAGCAPPFWDEDYGDNYYNQHQYQIFWHLICNKFAARFGDDVGEYFSDGPQIKLRNRVMEWLEKDIDAKSEGRTALWQWASARDGSNNLADNFNSQLSYFGASYGDLDIPIGERPGVIPIHGILRKSGYPIEGVYFIARADLRADVVLHHVDYHVPCHYIELETRPVYPQVKISCKIIMGIRVDADAWNAGEHELNGEQLLIEQHFSANDPSDPMQDRDNFPVVHGNRDTIQWFFDPDDELLPAGAPTGSNKPTDPEEPDPTPDDRRKPKPRQHLPYAWKAVRPDSRIRWRGEMGYYSEPMVEDIYPYVQHQNATYPCRIALGWNGGSENDGMYIYAAPSHYDDQFMTKRVYSGAVQLAFRTGPYCGQ